MDGWMETRWMRVREKRRSELLSNVIQSFNYSIAINCKAEVSVIRVQAVVKPHMLAYVVWCVWLAIR